MASRSQSYVIQMTERFVDRHIGPRDADIADMLSDVGYPSLEDLAAAAVPSAIRLRKKLNLPPALSEMDAIEVLRSMARDNEGFRSFIGMGYHGTVTPPPVLRNILEDPGWYTQYTPYQAEIAQGRLEALLNFQTMVLDFTGLEVANASLLDEATAAAEAMAMLHGTLRGQRSMFLVSKEVHPQTIAVVKTRAVFLNIEVRVLPDDQLTAGADVFGILVQYPCSDGKLVDYRELTDNAHAAGAHVVYAADLMALALVKSPGSMGADVVVGSAQRFGVPPGFGGPHAAFIAATESFKRRMPGRIVGVSVDAAGRPALRMALQTREQHIRREKATSNICTAQVLLAVMASMYAVYHGPEGIRDIAGRIHSRTDALASRLKAAGLRLRHQNYFDSLRIELSSAEQQEVCRRAAEKQINLRSFDDGSVGISIDETTSERDITDLLALFGAEIKARSGNPSGLLSIPERLQRDTPFLEHPVFHLYRSETELLRYIVHLRNKDLSLTTGMIPLGSCTMKLNAAAEMIPVSFPGFSQPHPFAPKGQAPGYERIFSDLENWLGEVTGLPAVSLQPNSGAQGEYAGLLVIRGYQQSMGEDHRNVCLIPSSAHGTNPASAVMAGMRVVIIGCDDLGNIDVDDLRQKAEAHRDTLSALMITYPSTHGVFEDSVQDICRIIHDNGGQVYLDGANMNAQVGLCRPSEIGADVCHLNLHKTFAIPHGGGGPGVGPICAAPHLAPFLPGHPCADVGGSGAIGPVSAAPWGSASVLTISWAYLAMLGAEGATKSTTVAILNANYMAVRLKDHFNILYRGKNGVVAHEFIIDFREIKKQTGVTEEDVAKRLMDYGFHAPTMSWPVPGTMMVEPTESESKGELDRFCDALIAIREEIRDVEVGTADKNDNVLKRAPHTATDVCSDDWDRPYSREKAAYPVAGLRERKFWPSVGRIDNAYGDRNLVCSCPPLEDYVEV